MVYIINVDITIINHPFEDGLYQLSMVMTGGWFIIVTIPTLFLVSQSKMSELETFP